jgi:hypothetical protein
MAAIKSERKLPVSREAKPSAVKHEYWLYAERKRGDYPKANANSGKWLIFARISRIDDLWTRIKLATENGRLGDLAKVATAKPNPIAANSRMTVICVYTYDWTDEADVRRVREELRALGVTYRIAYKADSDTDAGRYSKHGHERISKYYE